jgi:mannose-1-phosphate guanylyltransferase
MIMDQTIPATRPESRPPTARQRGAPAHVLILAGGEGLRALPVTRALFGDDRPKQFCALVGREPLVVQAQRRASLVVPPSRTLLVLTRVHEPYYRGLIYGMPASSLVVQPSNRGTGAAVLYGLLRIARKTPNAPVVILPSDHWVSDDAVFMAHAAAAIGIVRSHPTAVVLLGVAPTRPEREYGWIEPSAPIVDVWSDLHGVARFVEKPDPARALQMQKSGTSYWNTSVVAGSAEKSDRGRSL